jgi:hypothetical protein
MAKRVLKIEKSTSRTRERERELPLSTEDMDTVSEDTKKDCSGPTKTPLQRSTAGLQATNESLDRSIDRSNDEIKRFISR